MPHKLPSHYEVSLFDLENQVTPFNFTTPDHELIYAWHVMPLGLYAKHELEILEQPSGCVEDITKTLALKLLRDDPEARLIINCEFWCLKNQPFADVMKFTE